MLTELENSKYTIKVRKVFITDDKSEIEKDNCPVCQEKGTEQYLRYFYINMSEAVYKCGSSTCMFPYTNFKYKNFDENTVYQFQRIDDLVPKYKKEDALMETSEINNFLIDNWNIDDCTKDADNAVNSSTFNLSESLDNYLNFNAEDDENNIDNTFDMETIDGIIGEICNETNFNQSLDTDFDYSLNELTKYIENSPKKNQQIQSTVKPDISSIVSPRPRLQKCIKHIEEIIPDTKLQVLEKSEDNQTKLVKSYGNNHKVYKNKHNTKHSSKKISKELDKSAESKILGKNRKIEKDVQPVKKLILSDLLRNGENLTKNIRTIIQNKNNFKPLDLIETLNSLQKNTISAKSHSMTYHNAKRE